MPLSAGMRTATAGVEPSGRDHADELKDTASQMMPDICSCPAPPRTPEGCDAHWPLMPSERTTA